MAPLEGPWVCSVCGSDHIVPSSIQASLGVPAHPLGLCMECRGTQAFGRRKDGKQLAPNRRPPAHPLSALCRPDEYKARHRPPPSAAPEDLFGSLPLDERKALERPLTK